MDPKAVEAATTGGDLVNKQGSGKNGQQGRLFGNNGQQGRLFGKNGQQGRLFGKNGQQGRGMNKNGMNKQGQHKNGMNKNKWGSNKNKKKNKNKWGSNKNKKKNKNGMPSSLGQIANSLSLGRQMKQLSLLQESDGALSEEVVKAMDAKTRRLSKGGYSEQMEEEVDLAPITPAAVELKQDLRGLWDIDHISGLFCPGSPEAEASESATNKEDRTEGKEMALVAFSKLIDLQKKCDKFQKKVVRTASALPEDRKSFLSTSSIYIRGGKVLLYSPEGSAKEGKTATGRSLTERLHGMEERMKCRNEKQPLDCVQEGVLTFFERVVAMCDENVLIGDELPSVATRGMTSGASSSNNNKQECSPKDALFLLDVQFPGSYLEDLTDCGAHQSTIVSSM